MFCRSNYVFCILLPGSFVVKVRVFRHPASALSGSLHPYVLCEPVPAAGVFAARADICLVNSGILHASGLLDHGDEFRLTQR